jgi:hypothetical protein
MVFTKPFFNLLAEMACKVLHLFSFLVGYHTVGGDGVAHDFMRFFLFCFFSTDDTVFIPWKCFLLKVRSHPLQYLDFSQKTPFYLLIFLDSIKVVVEAFGIEYFHGLIYKLV